MANIFQEIQSARRDIALLRNEVAELKRRSDENASMLNQQIQIGQSSITEKLEYILAAITPEAAPGIVLMFVNKNGNLEELNGMQLKIDQSIKVVAKVVDKAGNAAEIEKGSAKFDLSNAAMGAFSNQSDDGLSADFTPAGPIGALTIQFSADADLGEGVTPLLGEGSLDLIAGSAVAVELSFA